MPMYYTASFDSPLGTIGLACSDAGLTAAWFPSQSPFPHPAAENPEHPILRDAARWLEDYFAGKPMDPRDLPLAPAGTPFRQVIWQLLLEIPYGQATTYGALAKEAAAILGKERMSAQAVGGAVGANPIALIIPCHRCLGAAGRLTGYTGGLAIKRWLLTHEGIPFHE